MRCICYLGKSLPEKLLDRDHPSFLLFNKTTSIKTLERKETKKHTPPRLYDKPTHDISELVLMSLHLAYTSYTCIYVSLPRWA